MRLLQKCASAGGWAKEAGALEAVKECLKFWKGEAGCFDGFDGFDGLMSWTDVNWPPFSAGCRFLCMAGACYGWPTIYPGYTQGLACEKSYREKKSFALWEFHVVFKRDNYVVTQFVCPTSLPLVQRLL